MNIAMRIVMGVTALFMCGAVSAEPTMRKFLSADEAMIDAVKRWQQTGRARPIVSDDGTVLYPYGQYQPKVVCSPLRVCDIALQPGEKITDTPSAGDDVRWKITKSVSGEGDKKQVHVVVKPTDVDLETNLIVRTDRRVYHMTLFSRNNGEYVNQVAFYYPNDVQTAWVEEEVVESEAKKNAEKVAASAECTSNIERMDTAYEIKGGTEKTRPALVFNNGVKTCIQMPDDVNSWEAAVFVLIGKDDKKSLTNYRLKGQWYIVDRVVDHGALLLGENGEDSRIDIVWKKAPVKREKSSSTLFGGLFK